MILEPGTIVAQRYRLVSPIDGGNGCVWAAEHVALGRRVAIKIVPRAEADPRGTFIRDARSAAAVRHRNVVGISDFGVDGEAAYVVMEMLEGQTLAARLASPLYFGTEEALEALSGAIAGLGALHEGGVVHANLCPQSVFLAREEDGVVVAKVIGVGLSRGTVGANAYMSPERALGRGEVDVRSDLFSAGVILYEALTGRPAEPAVATFAFPPLRMVRPGVRPEIAAVVERAIAIRREDRWSGAREMRKALLEAAGVVPEPSQVVVLPPRERRTTAGSKSAAGGTNPTLVAVPKRRPAWTLVALVAVLFVALTGAALLATLPAGESSAVPRTAEASLPASTAMPATAVPVATAAPVPTAAQTAAPEPQSAAPRLEPRRGKRPPREGSPTGLLDDPGF